MSLRKKGIGFTYDPELKRVTYSMKEYIRSKHSYNRGFTDQYLICVYLMTTNIHFYINDEEDLENFLHLDHKLVEHEDIQERLYYTDRSFSMESEDKKIIHDIPEGTSRYVLTEEKYEAMKDERRIQIAEYITYHQE